MTAEVMTRTFAAEMEVLSRAKGGDGRTLVGIVVPYATPVRIDSRLTEQFARGAFNAQLRAAPRVPLYRDHKPHGGTLIGKATTLRDDAAGLYGEFRVSNTPKGDETLELAKDDVLPHFSVGFFEGQNRRLPGDITERATARLTEVAVVPEGAYGEYAAIADVRSAATFDARAELDRIVAGIPALSLEAELLTRSAHGGSNLKYGPGSPLWKYWTGPEGFARYAGAPDPWTTLRAALLKEGVPVSMVDGLTTNIMQATPAGRALFAAHHGKKAR
ncbi:HK97 family phage prohead protease [Amycolatopsis sp. FDAARGOS 1241]|uniref:HK97 family phage prohead protease n=1 Tax=Amycolatopsis sp. FDAARGOS 1241 TaxID=2778070 RepID=UPI00195146D7|nr:HK97 family phage prohead protease [Amycolatopsis sp. FDAARGOS 1241]QRP48000.1 HK97 family phage prohead protease [Amycolatopsis sp. FDAARGOS 1241]